jgi:hypothetical protein
LLNALIGSFLTLLVFMEDEVEISQLHVVSGTHDGKILAELNDQIIPHFERLIDGRKSIIKPE